MRTRRLASLVVVTALLGACACSLTAGAATVSAGAGLQLLTAPPGSGSASAAGISCPQPGSCALDGWSISAANSNAVTPFVDTATNATWSASTVHMPSNAATNPPYEILDAISCPTTASCTAVGDYLTTTGDIAPMAATAAIGSANWQVVELPYPTLTGGQLVVLNGVSCPSAGNCVAVGAAFDANGNEQAFVDTESNGAWSSQLLAPPGNAASQPFAMLNGVSCPTLASCVAVGIYTDNTSLANKLPLGATDLSGPWVTTEVAPPSNPPSSRQGAALYGVSCPAPGVCSAAGVFDDANNFEQPLVASLAASSWSAAPLAAPTDAVGNPQAGFNGISCSTVGSCTAVGDYVNASGRVLMSAVEQGGSWSPATGLAAPSGTTTSQYANAVGCAPTGSCGVAVFAGGTSADNGDTLVAGFLAPSLSITTTSIPSASVGSSYNFSLAATGGSGTYSWSVMNGALPAGLSLDPSSGAITGTPTAAGTTVATVLVTDQGPPMQGATLTITFTTGSSSSNSPPDSSSNASSNGSTGGSSPPVQTPVVPSPLISAPHKSAPRAVGRLVTSNIVEKANTALVPLRCSGTTCTGSVSLEQITETSHKVHGKPVIVKTTTVFASAHVRMKVGQSLTYVMALNALGLHAFAQAAKHPVTATVQLVIGGRTADTTVHVT